MALLYHWSRCFRITPKSFGCTPKYPDFDKTVPLSFKRPDNGTFARTLQSYAQTIGICNRGRVRWVSSQTYVSVTSIPVERSDQMVLT